MESVKKDGARMETKASDLRASIARYQVLIYKIAAQVGVHPSRLGLMLAERIPLPDAVAARVHDALEAARRRS